jgi:hypothetical protein
MNIYIYVYAVSNIRSAHSKVYTHNTFHLQQTITKLYVSYIFTKIPKHKMT